MGIIARVFSDTDWRADLDSELVRKLEKLLKRTKSYERAYKNADNPAMAQLWVAVAEMYYQMDKMNARLRKIEHEHRKLMEEIEGVESGLADEELRDSLDTY